MLRLCVCSLVSLFSSSFLSSRTRETERFEKKGRNRRGKCLHYTDQFDPTSEIQAELNKSSIGSKISLADLNWPEDIQNGIDAVNGALAATFIFYCIGIAACGLAIVFSLIAIFLNGARLFSFFNFGLAVVAFLVLVIASALVTAVMVKGANVINEFGNDAGVYAYKGGGYLALTWAATGIMLLASIFWITECCVGRRARRREYTEKPI
jgi:hypothetical protein